MRKIVSTLAFIAIAAATCGCWPDPYGNNAAQYVHRSQTITLSAGNASDVNTAAQTIDPWPPYVGDARVPANGERMVGAVQRYQRGGAARPQGQIGQGAGPGAPPGAPGAPPPVLPSGAAAVPPATLPY